MAGGQCRQASRSDIGVTPALGSRLPSKTTTSSESPDICCAAFDILRSCGVSLWVSRSFPGEVRVTTMPPTLAAPRASPLTPRRTFPPTPRRTFPRRPAGRSPRRPAGRSPRRSAGRSPRRSAGRHQAPRGRTGARTVGWRRWRRAPAPGRWRRHAAHRLGERQLPVRTTARAGHLVHGDRDHQPGAACVRRRRWRQRNRGGRRYHERVDRMHRPGGDGRLLGAIGMGVRSDGGDADVRRIGDRPGCRAHDQRWRPDQRERQWQRSDAR